MWDQWSEDVHTKRHHGCHDNHGLKAGSSSDNLHIRTNMDIRRIVILGIEKGKWYQLYWYPYNIMMTMLMRPPSVSVCPLLKCFSTLSSLPARTILLTIVNMARIPWWWWSSGPTVNTGLLCPLYTTVLGSTESISSVIDNASGVPGISSLVLSLVRSHIVVLLAVVTIFGA